jgi:hypothetical protein
MGCAFSGSDLLRIFNFQCGDNPKIVPGRVQIVYLEN